MLYISKECTVRPSVRAKSDGRRRTNHTIAVLVNTYLITVFQNSRESYLVLLPHDRFSPDVAPYKKASECSLDFDSMSDEEKFMFLFSNINLVRPCAKTCALILQRRQFLICKR